MTLAIVASVVLGTGEPPPTLTVSPVVGVFAVITVPAAIGFRRGGRFWASLPGLASPTKKLKVSEVPPYQVSPRTGVNNAVWEGWGPTCISRPEAQTGPFAPLEARPLVLAHRGRAADVDSTVSVARRT